MVIVELAEGGPLAQAQVALVAQGLGVSDRSVWRWVAQAQGRSERATRARAAVAERDGEIVGIAMSGPPLDAGYGCRPALLAAVVDPRESAALWVADPNPRAQSFYRKHGFAADGRA